MPNPPLTSRDVSIRQIRDLLRRYDIEPARAVEVLAGGIEGDERLRLKARISRERTRLKRAGELGAAPSSTEPEAEGLPGGGLPDLAAMSRADLLIWQLEILGRALQEASAGSTAYGQAARALKSTHSELWDLREAEARAGEIDPASLDAETWLLRVQEDAREATDEDLEVYVREWLRRLGYELEVSERGHLRLRRPGARLEIV